MGQFNNKIRYSIHLVSGHLVEIYLTQHQDLNVRRIKALKGVGVKVKGKKLIKRTITVPTGFVTDFAGSKSNVVVNSTV